MNGKLQGYPTSRNFQLARLRIEDSEACQYFSLQYHRVILTTEACVMSNREAASILIEGNRQ